MFFGDLGQSSQHLVSYLEAIPSVLPKPIGSNPATWMLEVIGAGTSANSSANVIDFHLFYCNSALQSVNAARLDALMSDDLEVDGLESGNLVAVKSSECSYIPGLRRGRHHFDEIDDNPHFQYNATYSTQFRALMYRFLLAYWRSPTYNFVRMVVSLVIALIFASTYADQQYASDVDVISRVAVMYVTLLFIGIVGMKSVQPVILDERPAFYREMYCKMYDIKLYVFANTLVEVSQRVFLLTFFSIYFRMLFAFPYFLICVQLRFPI